MLKIYLKLHKLEATAGNDLFPSRIVNLKQLPLRLSVRRDIYV